VNQQKAILLELAGHWDMATKDMEQLDRQKAAAAQKRRI
jgi:hypothetical protein